MTSRITFIVAISFTSFVWGQCLEALTYNCTTFTLSGALISATGINNTGVVVGSFVPESNPSGPSQGFVRDAAGNITIINYPGVTSTQLFTINNKGVIAGLASVGTFNPTVTGFTVDLLGNFKTITIPAPYILISIYGINDNGAISGDRRRAR